ncbi:MAG TPA: aldo/keto reductase, partial [Candidatus Baltobacteraceae bacterium]
MTSKIDASAAGTLTLGGDIAVQRMGFGGMRLCGPGIWGWPQDRQNALAVLRRAVELGVTLIDTADAYGPHVNEEQIAQALYPYPAGLTIATKCGLVRPGPGKWDRDARPERLRECAEGSLRRLRLERLDVLQLHAVDTQVPLSEQIGALTELQREGKVRYIGISNVTLEQLREARTMAQIVSVQNPFSVGQRHGNDAVVDYCQSEGLAFLPYFPLDAGDIGADRRLQAVADARGATIYQIALAWLL